jgi:hypothetical protein
VKSDFEQKETEASTYASSVSSCTHFICTLPHIAHLLAWRPTNKQKVDAASQQQSQPAASRLLKQPCMPALSQVQIDGVGRSQIGATQQLSNRVALHEPQHCLAG